MQRAKNFPVKHWKDLQTLHVSHTLADNKQRAYGLKYCMFMKTQYPVFDTMLSFWERECNF